jgi:hypothetical protein
MNGLLIRAALACNPGDRLVDLRDKIPRGLNSIDLVVTVEPFYARFYIYQPGFPESLQHAAATSLLRLSRCPLSTAVSASDKVSRG